MNHHVISPEEYRALIEARDAAIRDLAHWAREAGRWRGIAEGLEIERDRLAAALATARREGAKMMREWVVGYLLSLSAASPRWGSPEEHIAAIRALPLEDAP